MAARAQKLVRLLRGRGYRVIEVFPRASEQILGLSKEPRKNQDEYDALIDDPTGFLYTSGCRASRRRWRASASRAPTATTSRW
jgi:predicted nuclease with RNAse H fold